MLDIKCATIVDMTFSNWLLNELKKRDWNNSDLARHSRLTRQAVGNYINGRTPSPEAVKAIARALKVPPETVSRQAGLLPSESQEAAEIRELKHLFDQLPDNRKDDLLAFARHLLNLDFGVRGEKRSAAKKTRVD